MPVLEAGLTGQPAGGPGPRAYRGSGRPWLWSMYTYIPSNYPTRMRSLGTGWTDGMGHLGSWCGVLICGQLFMAAAPLNWILFITIPGALIPAILIGIFGVRQRRRTLEELAR